MSEVGRGAQRDGQDDALGSGAQPAFLSSAVDERLQHAGTDIQGADALGCVHLVTGDGEQVDAPGSCVDKDLPGRLGGVGVEEDAVGMGDARQIGDGLQHTGLVVRCHDRHQHGFRGEGLCQRRRVDPAVPVNGQICHLDAVQPLQCAAGLQGGRMLGGLGDDVCRCGPVMAQGGATDCEAVGLRSDPPAVNTTSAGSAPIRPASVERVVAWPRPARGGAARRRRGRWTDCRNEWSGMATRSRPRGVHGCGGVVVEIDGPAGQPRVKAGFASVVHCRGSPGHCIWVRTVFATTAAADATSAVGGDM